MNEKSINKLVEDFYKNEYPKIKEFNVKVKKKSVYDKLRYHNTTFKLGAHRVDITSSKKVEYDNNKKKVYYNLNFKFDKLY